MGKWVPVTKPHGIHFLNDVVGERERRFPTDAVAMRRTRLTDVGVFHGRDLDRVDARERSADFDAHAH